MKTLFTIGKRRQLDRSIARPGPTSGLLARRRSTWLLDCIAVLVLIGCALLLMVAAGSSERSTVLGMDLPATMLPGSGLRETEQFTDRPGIFRWTNGAAELSIPNPGGTIQLSMLLAAGPDGRSAPLDVMAGSSRLSLQVPAEPRRYHLLLGATAGLRRQLELNSPTVTVARRELGVVLGSLGVAGGGRTPTAMLLITMLATPAAYLVLRRALPGGRLVAGLVTALLLMLLALWYNAGAWRYEIVDRLVVTAAGAALLALVLERLPAREVAASRAAPAWTRRDVLLLGLILLGSLGVQVWFVAAPDPVGDLELAARRMGLLQRDGWDGAYFLGGDYLPLRLLILRLSGIVVARLGGTFAAPLPPVTLLAIKLPAILANLATLVIIFGWSRRWRSTYQAAAITALYALVPPIWINIAWWGQVDALLMLPLLGTIVAFERAGGRWSWVCWAIALVIKPQAIILAPLLYLATIRRYGVAGLVSGGACAAIIVVAGCTPLAMAGQGPGLYEAYFGSTDRFPWLTNGAYNLWYLLGGSAGVADIGQGIGPVSFRMLGFGLLGITTLLLCRPLLWRADRPLLAETATGLALAFFCLPTQIHERYLFLTLGFLILMVACVPRAIWAFGLLATSATLNILGTLQGFAPPLQPLIAQSPLPALLATINLAVLLWLLVRSLRVRPGNLNSNK